MKNDKTVSKLADAQTELTVLSSQPEHIQVQLQISAKARGWDSCRGFCAFRTEIVSPVSLYLSRGAVVGACPEPDRAAGQLQTGDERWASPWRKRIVPYIGKVE